MLYGLLVVYTKELMDIYDEYCDNRHYDERNFLKNPISDLVPDFVL